MVNYSLNDININLLNLQEKYSEQIKRFEKKKIAYLDFNWVHSDSELLL